MSIVILWGRCAAPGSKGSEGSARLQRAGSKGCGIALSGDEYIISLREMKTIQPPYGRKKQANRAAPDGNAIE